MKNEDKPTRGNWADEKVNEIERRTGGLGSYGTATARNNMIAAALREAAKMGAVWALQGVGCTCPLTPRNPQFIAHFGHCPIVKAEDIESGRVEVRL